jgi:protein TonB
MWTIAASYPSSARLLGEQGLVKVETDINEKGVVIACRVAVSSGFRSLDNAALDAVQQARFLPALKNGRPVASKILVPIRFQLTQE